jgi:uncharacterized protein YjdB
MSRGRVAALVCALSLAGLLAACSGGGTLTEPAIATVTVTATSTTVAVGQSVSATATLRDASGNVLAPRAVTWSTSNAGVATVSGAGVITGVTVGTATISATSEGRTGSLAITVIPPPVASVSVSLAANSIQTGQTTTATATLRDASGNILTGRAVTWSSSTPAVATVSSTGLVTGVGAGSATITATSEGQSGGATITVTLAPVATVTVTLASSSIQVGQTTSATATLRDASGNVLTGRTVSWSSSNSAVATVSSTGTVTGVSAGTATITATSEGRSGSATVSVTSAGACSLSLAIGITVGQTVSGSLSTSDCRLSDGSYIDYYRLTVTTTTTVTIEMISSAFDTFLFLLDSGGNLITFDDDSAGGTNSRIIRTLTAGTYYIGANSFSAGQTGVYTLTVR